MGRAKNARMDDGEYAVPALSLAIEETLYRVEPYPRRQSLVVKPISYADLQQMIEGCKEEIELIMN